EPAETKVDHKVPENWRDIPHLPDWKRRIYLSREKTGNHVWTPRKRISPEARMLLRAIKADNPDLKASHISKYFGISHEAVRRILRTKWTGVTPEEQDKIQSRWENRKWDLLKAWSKTGKTS
ncbi:uncharacterized protein V1516DRAFT_613901, partial [Lipomyces oligophaga]|uniref:uncharacterized protein n=1 Tax=Lipomyces oligophaga TaxID=45792 RepID=UPI0034CFEFFB